MTYVEPKRIEWHGGTQFEIICDFRDGWCNPNGKWPGFLPL